MSEIMLVPFSIMLSAKWHQIIMAWLSNNGLYSVLYSGKYPNQRQEIKFAKEV